MHHNLGLDVIISADALWIILGVTINHRLSDGSVKVVQHQEPSQTAAVEPCPTLAHLRWVLVQLINDFTIHYVAKDKFGHTILSRLIAYHVSPMKIT